MAAGALEMSAEPEDLQEALLDLTSKNQHQITSPLHTAAAPTFPLPSGPSLSFLPLQAWAGNVTLRPQNSSWTQAQGLARDRTRLRGSEAPRL